MVAAVLIFAAFEMGEHTSLSDPTRAEAADTRLLHPIMRPDPETRRMWIERYNRAPRVRIERALFPLLGSINLLDHLEYTPSERDQGYCGNCWAWAGTGVMEIALDVQEGIKDRLSIQYLNSCYGTGWDYACCGGWLEDLADFYSGTHLSVAWSNTNAQYQDYWRDCGDGSSLVSCSSVSTQPDSYEIWSIVSESIETHGTGQAAAINNIKNVLNQNKAVFFGFFLCNDADWQIFFDFWDDDSEADLFDFDYSCDKPWTSGGGGHAVLCVGYNDDSPSNRYWIMLNSWGTTPNRPNGLFRVSMDINYDCHDTTGDYNLYWQTLDINFSAPPTPTPTPVPTPAPPTPTVPTPGPSFGLAMVLNGDGFSAGEPVSLGISAWISIWARFDAYLIAESAAGTYTINLDGRIVPGIRPVASDIPRLNAPFEMGILQGLPCPASIRGTTNLYLVIVKAGKMPPVSSLDQLTVETPNVITMDRKTILVE